jgi:hypothetical protein
MSIDERFLISRRALLGGIGVAGISTLLPRGMSRKLYAQAAPPTRFLVVHVPEGMWNSAKKPKPGDTTLGPIFEALDPYMDQTIMMHNLAMMSRDEGPGGDGHHRGVPHMLTGTEMLDEGNAGGISVDQKLANAIGGGMKFKSLQLAVRIVYGDTNSRPLWSAPGRVVPALQDPWEAYDRIFDGVMPMNPTSGGNQTPVEPPKFDLRKSALDYAVKETASLRTRLSAPDRERLDSYQESLREIEKGLATVVNVSAGCSDPMLGSEIDVKSESNYPAIGKLQMDMIVAAFQCNLTRVMSLQWGNSNDQCRYSWLGVNALGHDLAHNNGNVDSSGAKKQTVYRWYSEQFAYLLGKLRAVPEGAGTMLDNTLILWVSEFGDSNGHNSNNLTWLLMGNSGGYFGPGRVVDMKGKATNDVHTTVLNSFGIADKTFGNPEYNTGPLDSLRA